MLLKVLKAPNTALRKKVMPVTEFNEELKVFANNLLETCIKLDGAGISSAQVEDDPNFTNLSANVTSGYRPQPNVIIISIDEDKIIAVNAEITSYSEEKVESVEGCLSVPKMNHKIERSARIKVKFQNLEGLVFENEYDGFKSICFQHEIDHANGILYPDRIKNRFEQELFWKKYQRAR